MNPGQSQTSSRTNGNNYAGGKPFLFFVVILLTNQLQVADLGLG